MKTLRVYAFWIISMSCFSLWESNGGTQVFAATPLTGEVIARCEDRTGNSLQNKETEDACTSVWSEEFQEQLPVPEDDREGLSFRWAPYELTESELNSELRLRYPPTARRPLWGY